MLATIVSIHSVDSILRRAVSGHQIGFTGLCKAAEVCSAGCRGQLRRPLKCCKLLVERISMQAGAPKPRPSASWRAPLIWDSEWVGRQLVPCGRREGVSQHPGTAQTAWNSLAWTGRDPLAHLVAFLRVPLKASSTPPTPDTKHLRGLAYPFVSGSDIP